MQNLNPSLVEQVLTRLGLDDKPPIDPDGLHTLYQRWCRSVPFDNTLKLIALNDRSDGPLPGMDANSFFEAWLQHGTGGTCWPSNNALHALVEACGFPARQVSASMADTGIASHGTCVVFLDGIDWLLDSSMLTDAPLQLRTDATTILEHPVFESSAEPVETGWLLHFSLPYAVATMPCRTLEPLGVTHAYCVERFEVSREMSPFNHQPSTRLNFDDGVVTYGGAKRYRRTAAGVEESDLSGDALFDGLRDEFGLSDEIVSRLASVLP